jgi:hypothetical protein
MTPKGQQLHVLLTTIVREKPKKVSDIQATLLKHHHPDDVKYWMTASMMFVLQSLTIADLIGIIAVAVED